MFRFTRKNSSRSFHASILSALNLSRHTRNCSVCGHAERPEIEAEFIAWGSPSALAKQYGLADRASIYRHAHAFGLFPKRQRNVRAALERIIEKAGEVEVTAAAVVGAIQAYSKINAAGQWIDRRETINLNDLFDRMTRDELEKYAQDGTLPTWFPETFEISSAARDHNQETENGD